MLVNIKEEAQVKKEDYYLDNAEECNYKSGDVVVHMTYGRGVVIAVDNRFVSVAFSKQYGIRKFLKNYKGLKKG